MRDNYCHLVGHHHHKDSSRRHRHRSHQNRPRHYLDCNRALFDMYFLDVYGGSSVYVRQEMLRDVCCSVLGYNLSSDLIEIHSRLCDLGIQPRKARRTEGVLDTVHSQIRYDVVINPTRVVLVIYGRLLCVCGRLAARSLDERSARPH